jgi:DNA-directed RNA polymerase subunit RPC12/RpoP
MTKNKTTSPENNLSIETYNLNGTERTVIKNDILYLSSNFTPDYHHKIENIVQKELKCVYVDPDPQCEVCKSRNLNKKYLNSRNLNKNHLVHVTSYICIDCSKIHRTSLELFIDKNDTYTRDVKGLAIHVNFLEHMSLNNISLLNIVVNDANPCRQTILNGLKKFFGKMKLKHKRNRKFSGNYGLW